MQEIATVCEKLNTVLMYVYHTLHVYNIEYSDSENETFSSYFTLNSKTH